MEGVVEHGKIDELLKTETNYEDFLKKQKEVLSQKSETFDKMLEYAQKKLYHELTELFVSHIKSEDLTEFQKVEFFRLCVDAFKQKICAIRFVLMLNYVAELIDSNDALKLFGLYEDFVQKDEEATYLFMNARAQNLCRSGQYAESEKILEEVKKKLDVNAGVTLSIFASLHKSYACLCKATNRLTEYYRHASLYLSYTPLDEISISERESLAYDLSVAAILSKDIYEFAELLEVSVVKENLKDGKDGWIHDFLKAFCNGDLKSFNALCTEHQNLILKSELAAHEDEMRHKITLLALMELAFNRPKNLRKIKFTEISEHCHVPMEEVEKIVMLSMSNHLIKGKIDEVEQVVNIVSIKPRILDNQRLEILREHMELWSESANELLVHLEGITPELLVS